MYESEQRWRDVDRYFIDELVDDDPLLKQARSATQAAGLPDHEVAPNQAKLLYLVCLMVGARRVLEFGTLGGYSTIWFARAVGEHGHVTTMELDETCVAVSRENFKHAQVSDRIRLLVGPAADSAHALIASGEEPFDVIFIDADKPNNPTYLAAALKLSKPGTVIIGDNVVRNGEVTNPDSEDARVQGSRALIHAIGSDPRLTATALQTVGMKGWDGFTLALVR